MSIFEMEHYRDIIRNRIDQNSSKRGYQTQLAKSAGCQGSYFSQVLKGQVHLTPDQAAALCEFWRLSDLEAEYFLTLVNHERAGTPHLQQRLGAQLARIRSESRRVGALVEAKARDNKQLDPQAAFYYWSHWYCPAIHGALSIPSLRTLPRLAEHFSLPPKLVGEVLEKLRLMGLVCLVNDEWQSTQNNIYVHDDETLIRNFHLAMRQRANFKLSVENKDELHYTWIDGVPKKDLPQIKARIYEAIKEQMQVPPSGEPEELVCFCFDFFSL